MEIRAYMRAVQNRARQIPIDFVRIDRRNPDSIQPGNSIHSSDQLGQPKPFALEIADIDPREHHFPVTIRNESFDFGYYVFQSPRSRTASDIWNDAISAKRIASILHFHECARMPLEPLDLEFGQIHFPFKNDLDQAFLVLVRHYFYAPSNIRKSPDRGLGHAPRHHQARLRMDSSEMSDFLPRRGVGPVRHRAGIYNAQIDRVAVLSADIAHLAKLIGKPLGFVLVCPAA